MTDDEIIRARLLVDERPLKRLIKKFYTVASCSPEDLDNSYAQFVLELDSQDTVAALKAKTTSVANEEITTYEEQIRRIQEETEESERRVLELKQDLATAQQTRRNKIIYDAIAKEALKLPSRVASAETIQRLTAELRDLEAEQQKYAVTWASRQEAFGAVVKSLEELGETVKEEKSEQERKDALRDDDMQDGDVKGGEDSSAEDTDSGSHMKKPLDPHAPSFEPSPLRQEQTLPSDQANDPEQMEVDEEALDDRKPRSRTTSTREEGEEGEEDESSKVDT